MALSQSFHPTGQDGVEIGPIRKYCETEIPVNPLLADLQLGFV